MASWLPDTLYSQLLAYLLLLMRWNERTNLTAIREPEEIVTRHFGESLFAAVQLQPEIAPGATLLDVGSGAGFPGLPIQLALPGLSVTLAESQGKKASFLREAVRTLGAGAEVWPGRVEMMGAQRQFDVVTLRAVDKMESATRVAVTRLRPGGLLAELGGEGAQGGGGLTDLISTALIPGGRQRLLRLWRSGPE